MQIMLLARSWRFRLLLLVGILLSFTSLSYSDQVTFEWDANIESDLTGYRLHWGPISRQYENSIDLGNVTTYTLDIPLETYVAATAYNIQGLESDYSNEVLYESIATIAPATGGSITYKEYGEPPMAIALDAVSSGTDHGVTSVTFAHTCAGDNRLLVVGVRGSAEPTGITFNGDPLSVIWSGSVSNNAWYIKNPDATTGDIVVTFAGSTTMIIALACSFTGVDQTTPLDTPGTLTSAYAETVDVDISSAVNDWVIDFIYVDNETPTPGVGQTARIKDDIYGSWHHCSTKAGEATCNMSWSWTGETWGRINGVSINPAAAVGVAPTGGLYGSLVGPFGGPMGPMGGRL